MIQFFHVNKFYPPSIYALKDISLSVEKGDFVYLTGPSGAGKSTLISLLNFTEKPTGGKIVIKGKDISTFSNKDVQKYRQNIGVVFQNFKLLQNKTVYENIILPMLIKGVPKKEIEVRALALLNFIGLFAKKERYPYQLSGGEQQRIAIARAISNNPFLLLADEPTGNLDEELAIEIMSLLREINIKGTTVILATHKTEFINKFGGKVFVLDRGKIESE